jgi:tetratricopeptide (TPR) repeat protein
MTAEALARFRDALVSAFPDPPRARELAERAGFAEGSLPIDQRDMRGWWWAALHEAWRQGILVALVERAIADEVIGPDLKQPLIELRESVAELQARPALRPKGVRVTLAVAAGLLVIAVVGLSVAAVKLGVRWRNAPVIMEAPPGHYKIAVAQFGHLTPEGRVESSKIERDMSALVAEQLTGLDSFAANLEPPLELDPRLVWHDSMPWYEKRRRLGVVKGATEEEQRKEAKELADDIKADMLIYGGEVESGDVSGLALRYYSTQLSDGIDLIDESQLGRPISLSHGPGTQLGPINDLKAYARALALFSMALNYEASSAEMPGPDAANYYPKSAQLLAAASSVISDSGRTNGMEVLYFYLGRAKLKMGKNEEALAHFEEANKKDSKYPRPFLGMGSVRLRQAQQMGSKDPEEALALLEESLAAYDHAAFLAKESSELGSQVKAHVNRSGVYMAQAAILHSQGDQEQMLASLEAARDEALQALATASKMPAEDQAASHLRALGRYAVASASQELGSRWCDMGDLSQATGYYQAACEDYQRCDQTVQLAPTPLPGTLQGLQDDCALRMACTALCLGELQQGGQDGCYADPCRNICEAVRVSGNGSSGAGCNAVSDARDSGVGRPDLATR